jgi:hypothetical protein
VATAAAEAGFLAGQSYLKDHCEQGRAAATLHTQGGSFRATAGNNADDPRFGDGADTDGIVVLVVTGRGPLGDEVTLEARVESTKCPEEIVVTTFAIQRRP